MLSVLKPTLAPVLIPLTLFQKAVAGDFMHTANEFDETCRPSDPKMLEPRLITILQLSTALIATVCFIWIVGCQWYLPNRIAAFLMVFTSCIWWATDGNTRLDLLSQPSYFAWSSFAQI